MANKKRTVYNVDEDVLKRMVAGDTSAMEKIKEEQPEDEEELLQQSEQSEKKEIVVDKKTTFGKKSRTSEYEKYTEQFLKIQLTGSRRQTYIHDSLYRMIIEFLPVVAPDMSVPTFVNNVLSKHLEQYEDIINEMYNLKGNKKPVQWKK